jgi:signal peptidase I
LGGSYNESPVDEVEAIRMAQSPMAQPPVPSQQPRQKSFVRDTLEIVFLALVLYVVIQYAVQTVHVLGSSMLYTLHDNDLLVASKVSYKIHPPQRGDIIVFKPPDEASRDFIKRIIALPGERLRIINGVVYINDQVLHEPYLPEKWTYNNNWPASGQDYILPTNMYFVMGDNRNHSSDSRTFGPITLDSILGKAEVRIWPLNEVGFLSGKPSLGP